MAATSAETGPGQVQGTDIKINGISHFLASSLAHGKAAAGGVGLRAV